MIGVNDAHQVINIFGVETTTSRLTSFTPDLAITPGRRTRVRERAAQTVMKARERERERDGGRRGCEQVERLSADARIHGHVVPSFNSEKPPGSSEGSEN